VIDCEKPAVNKGVPEITPALLVISWNESPAAYVAATLFTSTLVPALNVTSPLVRIWSKLATSVTSIFRTAVALLLIAAAVTASVPIVPTPPGAIAPSLLRVPVPRFNVPAPWIQAPDVFASVVLELSSVAADASEIVPELEEKTPLPNCSVPLAISTVPVLPLVKPTPLIALVPVPALFLTQPELLMVPAVPL
jgi:hypothetical protein